MTNKTSEKIATWRNGPYTSTMDQVGQELHVKWNTDSVNQRIVFHLGDLRRHDDTILRQIISEIYTASRWAAKAPGTTDDGAPAQSAQLFPLETSNKFLATIEDQVGY